ncbi:hypothetical protein PCC7418_1845 [Halothece sp. PCC 7418]|uniref:DUF4189 domain-containing protein n=1 Tax=Halothece sp. (strain PCC 7418) TaxID=65093 RepID=UPI0002A067D4|nr:DUF4189 domain-containing protein [Halothece sp. PCC 7418]AFZ44013.1 hypothetical protein PCC7418_1845 [Halothece sp. PCC 7418]
MNRLLLLMITASSLFISASARCSEEDLAQSQSNYGAIAYSSSSDVYGRSWNYSSRQQAETRALRECQSRSAQNDCTVVTWFRDACGALATTPNNGYGGDWGNSIVAAERNALQICSQYGRNCTILTSVCSDR